MANYKKINAYDAKLRLLKDQVKIADIRDRHAFQKDHIQGAFHLTNATISQFISEVNLKMSVFVICYHGSSSKGVAQYLCEQGYVDVSSIDGGMMDWRIVHSHD